MHTWLELYRLFGGVQTSKLVEFGVVQRLSFTVQSEFPRNSFIAVDDFAEAARLVRADSARVGLIDSAFSQADCLLHLARNDTAYLEYHRWRVSALSGAC
jgi:hypothetical protein